MTDLHDLNTRNERVSDTFHKFGITQPYYTDLCHVCMRQYGDHYFQYDKCVCPTVEGDWNDEVKEVRRFWMCYVDNTNGGSHYRHYSMEEAEEEAERLAKLTGEKVYLLECIGVCSVEPAIVAWEVPRE